MLCFVVWWRNRKVAPVGAERASWSEIGRTLLVAAPALALPFIIRAAVVEGVATATEVYNLSTLYTGNGFTSVKGSCKTGIYQLSKRVDGIAQIRREGCFTISDVIAKRGANIEGVGCVAGAVGNAERL